MPNSFLKSVTLFSASCVKIKFLIQDVKEANYNHNFTKHSSFVSHG